MEALKKEFLALRDACARAVEAAARLEATLRKMVA